MSYTLRVDRLRDLARKQGDESQYAIAKRTGLSEPTVSKIVSGKHRPRLETLLIIRRAYGCTVDELIEEMSA
ncbi:helix-turn-helix transcriptional regulator [Streptomyces sp. NPDC058045]|uniref:helix-turn-helix transcriptional regulator n=1 Tax=Streptomyces sp. NPDC058045 TaxID=3346311 RepID=UPI0036EAC9ED